MHVIRKIHIPDFKQMITGRAISGLGVGLGVPATAIYVAEVLYKNKQIK